MRGQRKTKGDEKIQNAVIIVVIGIGILIVISIVIVIVIIRYFLLSPVLFFRLGAPAAHQLTPSPLLLSFFPPWRTLMLERSVFFSSWRASVPNYSIMCVTGVGHLKAMLKEAL